MTTTTITVCKAHNVHKMTESKAQTRSVSGQHQQTTDQLYENVIFQMTFETVSCGRKSYAKR